MTTITHTDAAVRTRFDEGGFDDAQLAAASFLGYSGRTLEACREDLRGFFQWAADHDVPVHRCVRTSSCGEARWRRGGSPRRRSTVGSRRCAASTGSLTSTAASVRPPPSTSAARRSTPPTPWPGPIGARHVPGRRRPLRQLAPGARRAARLERSPGERGVRYERRGPRRRARPPDPADHRQGLRSPRAVQPYPADKGSSRPRLGAAGREMA
jgi:hypothetical protein